MFKTMNEGWKDSSNLVFYSRYHVCSTIGHDEPIISSLNGPATTVVKGNANDAPPPMDGGPVKNENRRTHAQSTIRTN